jgi:phosphate transport system substrate-binding protein
MRKFMRFLATVSLLIGLSIPAYAQVDESLPNYTPVSGISGSLSSIGSDTLNNLMTYWAEGFRSFYPNVQVQIQGAGSGTAPPALIEGTAQFGPMSRPMRGTEIETFENRYGYPPVPIRGAIDALGVFVHRDNPIECMTLQEVDAVLSSTRLGGANSPITTWGQLGLTSDWANRPISMYGRNSASGTYGYFKDVALFGGDYNPEVREQPGSSTVIQGIANDVNGIGYSGIGYATADVKPVALRMSEDDECALPTLENAVSGAYPLARFLYIYVNHDPNRSLDPLRAEFIRYVYSKEGQSDVVRAGFFPLVRVIAEADLETFNIQ